MLSYRHGFHAGGWSEVLKHVVLTILIAHLRKKAAPFTVVDAYAGDAVYDLASPEVQKTHEFETGIARIYDADKAPEGVRAYLEAVRTQNAGGRLSRYPGSPALIKTFLRDSDRLIANELHPTAHQALAKWARGDPRIAVHKRDALEFLGWVATSRLKRGLALIDPVYEVKAEYSDLPETLSRALRSWPQGIYAIWYPVLAAGRHRTLLKSISEALRASGTVKAVACELGPTTPPPIGLKSTGMIVINPPWSFEADLRESAGWLAQSLWAPGKGRYTLVPLSS